MVARTINDIPRILTGSFAIAISLLLVLQQYASPMVVIAALYLSVICLIDTLYAKIPNWASVSLVTAALSYHLWAAGLPGMWLTTSGFIVGFSLLLIPYLLGGMGGGDVKALAALGALLGPQTILQVFLYIALIGGALSIVHYLFSRNFLTKAAGAGRALMAFAGTRDVQILRPEKTESLRFPYASAITFGFYCFTQWGSIFSIVT